MTTSANGTKGSIKYLIAVQVLSKSVKSANSFVAFSSGMALNKIACGEVQLKFHAQAMSVLMQKLLQVQRAWFNG